MKTLLTEPQGHVELYVTGAPCLSCLGAMWQFQKILPKAINECERSLKTVDATVCELRGLFTRFSKAIAVTCEPLRAWQVKLAVAIGPELRVNVFDGQESFKYL